MITAASILRSAAQTARDLCEFEGLSIEKTAAHVWEFAFHLYQAQAEDEDEELESLDAMEETLEGYCDAAETAGRNLLDWILVVVKEEVAV